MSFLLVLYTCSVLGASVVDTNQGEVFVEEQQSEQINAFKQVVIKMTGTRTSIDKPSIRQAFKTVDDFILSYEYYIENDKQKYKAIFDKNKIELLIEQAQLPIWGTRRPDGIIWLATKDKNNTHVVAESDSASLVRVINNQAQARGVELLLPLMDLDDRFKVNETDVWARFMPVLEDASIRYAVDYTIGARIIEVEKLVAQQALTYPQNVSTKGEDNSQSEFAPAVDKNRTTLDDNLNNQQVIRDSVDTINSQKPLPQDKRLALEWTFKGNNENYSGRFYANDTDSLIKQFISHYADSLGAQYAISPNENEILSPTLMISNIQSLSDSYKLNQYLNDLTVVQTASLNKLEGSIATYTVTLIGSLTDLNNTIALDKRLTKIVSDQDLSSLPLQLNYFWQG